MLWFPHYIDMKHFHHIVSTTWCLILITIIGLSGCTTSHVPLDDPTVAEGQQEEEETSASFDFSELSLLEEEWNPRTVSFDFETQDSLEAEVKEEEQAPSDPAQFSNTCHKEELIGFPALNINEPDLLDDVQCQDPCAESVSPWCAPEHEAEYHAYLQQQEALQRRRMMLSNFAPPIENGLLLRGVKIPAKKWQRGHYGLDIIPSGWTAGGTPIKAVDDGVVVTSSAARGYGYYTLIYHQHGIFSLYSHTLKRNRVQTGEFVHRGEHIAFMGKSGNARGYHLHFELLDLAELWDSEQSLDEVIHALQQGTPRAERERGHIFKLIFSRRAKRDPLPYIPGLTPAKRVNGKWLPSERAKTLE